MTQNVDFNDYIENYNEILSEGLKFFENDNQYFAEYKINTISKYINNNPKKILEFGCGIGRNLKYIKKFFPNSEIYATDISQNIINFAKNNNPDINFFILNEKIETKFDLIFIAGVFHHIKPEQRNNIMKVIADALEPKGQLFIFEHNPFNPVTRHIVNNCPFDKDAVLLKPNELNNLLITNNLKITKLEYCLFIPSFLKKIRFLEKYFKKIMFGGQYFIQATKD